MGSQQWRFGGSVLGTGVWAGRFLLGVEDWGLFICRL